MFNGTYIVAEVPLARGSYGPGHESIFKEQPVSELDTDTCPTSANSRHPRVPILEGGPQSPACVEIRVYTFERRQ